MIESIVEVFVCCIRFFFSNFAFSVTYQFALDRNPTWVRKNQAVLKDYQIPSDQIRAYIAGFCGVCCLIFFVSYDFIWIIHLIRLRFFDLFCDRSSPFLKMQN